MMKGTSKVIMGATLVMVLSLAIVLGLVLVLLAELYCSLLLRRRQIKNAKNLHTAAAATSAVREQEISQQYPSPLSSFYSQGVLHAPRSFLFPMLATTATATATARKEDEEGAGGDDVERQHGKLHQFLSLENSTPPHDVSGGDGKEELMYISNPIYDNDVVRQSCGGGHTPFETPDSSPSRLERGRGSSEEDETVLAAAATATTPPLTPMKELPAKASWVALSLGNNSGSESNSQNAAFTSTSYSGSPSTSSW